MGLLEMSNETVLSLRPHPLPTEPTDNELPLLPTLFGEVTTEVGGPGVVFSTRLTDVSSLGNT
jgi:hypothetical protein